MSKKTKNPKKLFLVPRSGLRVLDPISGKPLAAAGESKPRSNYWLRRIKDGDVTEGKPQAASAPKKSKGE